MNSNDTDTPSESSAGRNPFVGPQGVEAVHEEPAVPPVPIRPVGSVPSPSTPPVPLRVGSPVRMTYPVKIPVSTPVSERLVVDLVASS